MSRRLTIWLRGRPLELKLINRIGSTCQRLLLLQMEMLYLNIRRCIPIGSYGKRTEKVDYFLLYSGLLGNIKVQKQRLTLLLAFTLILAPIVNRLGHVILLLYFVEKANPEIWTYVIKFLSASIHKDRGSLNFRPSFFELHPTCVVPYRM